MVRRWLPFVASFWCAPVIILSLHTLLAGFNNGSLEGAAIITFNTSSLGLSDYNQSNSTLHREITALVPASVVNPTSITKYLGIKDWYSMHYLSVCSGSFEPSSEDPNFLTSNKIDIVCVKQPSGYVFSISDTLRHGIDPSVAAIADEVTQASYYTASWIALWYVGIFAAIVDMFIFLPLTWHGTRRLNGYSTLVSFISYISFQLGSSLATGHALKAHHSQSLPPALQSTEYFAMCWTTMCLMFVVFILVQFEWRFELWTLKGDPITLYSKPKCKSWSLLSALYDRNPTKTESCGGDEEYEMPKV